MIYSGFDRCWPINRSAPCLPRCQLLFSWGLNKPSRQLEGWSNRTHIGGRRVQRLAPALMANPCRTTVKGPCPLARTAFTHCFLNTFLSLSLSLSLSCIIHSTSGYEWPGIVRFDERFCYVDARPPTAAVEEPRVD